MSTTTCTAVVLAEDPAKRAEAMAVGGFLAGYSGATRTSYATDLRIFATWCRQADLSLLTVKRSQLELFGRWMEETGRMRSTVARRLSTLASFYRYCEQEELVDRNPALNVRRPKVDYESRTLGLDRNELGAFLVQAGLGSEALGADVEDLDLERGHRTPHLSSVRPVWTATPPIAWSSAWPEPRGSTNGSARTACDTRSSPSPSMPAYP